MAFAEVMPAGFGRMPAPVGEASPEMNTLRQKIGDIQDALDALRDRLEADEMVSAEEFNEVAGQVPGLRDDIVALPEYAVWREEKDPWKVGSIPIREFIPGRNLHGAVSGLWATLGDVSREVRQVGDVLGPQHNRVMQHFDYCRLHYEAVLAFLNA